MLELRDFDTLLLLFFLSPIFPLETGNRLLFTGAQMETVLFSGGLLPDGLGFVSGKPV